MSAMHLLLFLPLSLWSTEAFNFDCYHHHRAYLTLYGRSKTIMAAITQPEPQMEWIKGMRGLQQPKKFSLTKFGGVRGVVADEHINDNDIVLIVPEDLVIQTANNRPPTPNADFVSQKIWEGSKWDQRVCYKLLWEKYVLGDNSPLASWLNQLPCAYDTTFHWKDQELEELQYDSLRTRVEDQRRIWKSAFDTWREECKFLIPPQSSTTWGKQVSQITFDKFVWGLETVNSRAFSGSYEGSSAADRRKLFFLTGALTLAYPLLGFGTPEEAIQGAIAVGLSIFVRDFFFSRYLYKFR